MRGYFPLEKRERNIKIYKEYMSGTPARVVGEKFGISTCRVYNVVTQTKEFIRAGIIKEV